MTEAKYWTQLIGRIVETTGPKSNPMCRVVFVYKRDGAKLASPEEFMFPCNRLRLVTDFAARVRSQQPKAAPAAPPDPFFDCEEVLL